MLIEDWGTQVVVANQGETQLIDYISIAETTNEITIVRT